MNRTEALKRKQKRAEKRAANAAYIAATHATLGSLKPARKKRKKKAPTLSKLKKILWREISALVRSWSEICLACKNRPAEVAAHIVPSHEGAATRFFLPNLYPACSICNGLEKWNRGSWVKVHESMFGVDFVDALYAYSETIFDLDKAWVIEQTERMVNLRARSANGNN